MALQGVWNSFCILLDAGLGRCFLFVAFAFLIWTSEDPWFASICWWVARHVFAEREDVNLVDPDLGLRGSFCSFLDLAIPALVERLRTSKAVLSADSPRCLHKLVSRY